MTSYTTSMPGADPTNVVGRRIGAWIIDLIIFVILWVVVATVSGFEVKTYEGLQTQTAAERFCDAWQDRYDGTCIATQDSAITVEGPPVFLILVAGHMVAYGVLSGVLGGSLGKLAVGLRVVTADGQRAGIGKNLLRTVLWVGDAFTCMIPLIGGIMMVSTKGHRRLGDMAAGTFVVDKGQVGLPLEIPGLTSPATAYGPGYAPPSYGAPAGWDVGAPTGPPQQPGWGTGPTQQPPGSWGQPMPPAGPTPPMPSAPTPTAGATPGADSPTWDPARNAYIQYDRELAAWMQWDDATNAWKPITQ
ncbi:MAG: RDD family protein [Actinobacteria bacterium]|nr:RDD family protein [Actinomycetota bacterium]